MIEDEDKNEEEEENTLSALVHVLMRLPTDVPNLSKFSMSDFYMYSDALLPHISSTICSFLHLSYVSTDSAAITAQALLHLAGLPRLTDLMTRLHSNDGGAIMAALKAPFDRVYFPELRSLKLVYQDSFPVVSALIRATHSPNLEELDVEFLHPHIPVQDLKDVFWALAERASRNRLTRLRVANLAVPSPATFTSTQPVIDGDILAPLTMLDGLTILIFHISTVPFFITDETFGRLVRSWPKIQELRFGNHFPPTTSGRPPATLNALVFIVHHCPYLDTLMLPLNPHSGALADSVAIREAHSVLRREQRALTSLNIGRSPIDGKDVVPAAAFLSGLFPALKNIHNSLAYMDDLIGEDVPYEERLRICREAHYREQWEMVLELHPGFVMVREEEREWARVRSAIRSSQK